MGAKAPVNLYVFPLYLNTIPSDGTIELIPPIAFNLSNCAFKVFNFFKSPPLLTFDIALVNLFFIPF